MNIVKEVNCEVRALSKHTSDAGVVIVIIRFSALPTVSSGLARENLIDWLWVL